MSQDKLEEERFRAAWNQGLSGDELAKMFGVGRSTINAWRSRLGLRRTAEEKCANIKKTFLNKYGVENVFQDENTKEKIKKSMIDKYGADHPSKVESIIKKSEQTCLEKYGVQKIGRSTSVREKIEKTCVEKYGAKSYVDTKEFRERSVETCLKKYGCKNPAKSDVIRDKIKKTCMDRYGVETTLLNPDTQEKIKNTLIEKYGTDKSSKTHYNEMTIRVLGSKENMEQHILQCEDKSISSLMAGLNCGRCAFVRNLHKYGLYQYAYLFRSSYELEISNYIKSIGVNCISSCRDIIPPKEIDIYCPDHNIGIEFNGDYWHSSLQVPKQYHFDKSKEAQDVGVRIIHIYEHEWTDPVKQNIIKSMLAIALGRTPGRIYARNCEIREITNKEAKPFNSKNHLQGHKNAQVTYGLFYHEELVQLMSFSYNKKMGWWEIERGCPGSNNIVVGGVSRLFKNFIRIHNPEKIFSYCDFNKFDGKGYEAIGMKFIGYTGPDMKWLMEDGSVHNRCPGRHKYFAENAMAKIWGAGSKKYLWEKTTNKD